jgi:hypothetical protein
MNDLITRSINLSEGVKTEDIDKCFEIKFDNLSRNDDDYSLNISNIDIKKLKKLIQSNSKLYHDFFKFGIYKHNPEAKQIFSELKIPYKSLGAALEYAFELKDLNILQSIIDKNSSQLLEQEVAYLLDSLLNKDLSCFAFSDNVDRKKYFITKLMNITM